MPGKTGEFGFNPLFGNKNQNNGSGSGSSGLILDWWSQRWARAQFLLNKTSIQVDTPKRFDYSITPPSLFGLSPPTVSATFFSGTNYYLEGIGSSELIDQPGINLGLGAPLKQFSGALVDGESGTLTTFVADTGSEIINGGASVSNQGDSIQYPACQCAVNTLKVTIGINGTGTKPVTFTLYKNGTPTAITCTVAAGQPAYTKASDIAHTVIFLNGDTWDVQATAIAPMGGQPVAFSASIEGFALGTGPNSATLIASPKATSWYVARKFMVQNTLTGGQAVLCGLQDLLGLGNTCQVEVTFPDSVQMRLRLTAAGIGGPQFFSLGPSGVLGGPLCPLNIPVTLEMYFDVTTGTLSVGLQDETLLQVSALGGNLSFMPQVPLQMLSFSSNFNVQLFSLGGFAAIRGAGDSW